ncbi:MAG TPA: cytochrome P450 [Sphingobium sp.]|uniref:cytochrome P450 n=1 Tax=Sphingobium sp. TaxID=1912891 RepID=UPI002ED6208D
MDKMQTPSFWPFARSVPSLPPEEYAERREKCPISRVELWDGSQAWLLTRYADIRSALRDARFSADSSVAGFPAPNAAIAAARKVQRGFVRLDGADHSRQRNLLAKYFTVSHVQMLRDVVSEKVDALLDEMEAHGGPFELVEHVAEPLPIFLTCVQLGLPLSDVPYLLERVKTWMSSDSLPEESTRAADDIVEHFRDVIARERAERTQGMVSDLVHNHVVTGELSEEDLLWMLHLLLVGGFDTAANMIGLGTLTLMSHPAEIARLNEEPGRITKVVEELLRLHSVAHFVAGRLAKEEVTLGATCISAGEGILAPLPAANFDPEVFVDPCKFDPDRNARAHLAFGFGIHQCLGQPIARLELAIFFAKIFKRFPTLGLAVPIGSLEYNNAMIYGLKRLPVVW